MPLTIRPSTETAIGTHVVRGTLTQIAPDGDLLVRPDGDASVLIPCDVVNSVGTLHAGDAVVFTMPSTKQQRGYVLGAIGQYKQESEEQETDKPHLIANKQTIELTAETKLVLRCGEGSISIGEDGTIIIKGARILSRSKGVNKIKGASVQIN